MSNSLKISLRRNRYLVAMCVGQGNEAVFICEKSKVGNHYTDLGILINPLFLILAPFLAQIFSLCSQSLPVRHKSD